MKDGAWYFIERPLDIDPVALCAMALRVDVLSDEGNPTAAEGEHRSRASPIR